VGYRQSDWGVPRFHVPNLISYCRWHVTIYIYNIIKHPFFKLSLVTIIIHCCLTPIFWHSIIYYIYIYILYMYIYMYIYIYIQVHMYKYIYIYVELHIPLQSFTYTSHFWLFVESSCPLLQGDQHACCRTTLSDSPWSQQLQLGVWKSLSLGNFTIHQCGYGSIPIDTIFGGMNIHKSQLFWCSPGVQGFDTLPCG